MSQASMETYISERVAKAVRAYWAKSAPLMFRTYEQIAQADQIAREARIQAHADYASKYLIGNVPMASDAWFCPKGNEAHWDNDEDSEA